MFKGMFKSQISQVEFSLKYLLLSKSLPANFLKNWESAAWQVECLFIECDRLEQREITPENHHDLAYSGSRILSLALQSNRGNGGYRQKIALPK